MTLLWPMALALLGPWIIACVRLARRGDVSYAVPFVRLWPTSPAGAARSRGRPPLWVVLVLAGALLAILAAAGPALVTTATTVTVLVDRRPAMTPARVRQAFDRLNLPAGTVVRMVPVPGDAFDGLDLARLKPTAIDTTTQLLRAIRQTRTPAAVLTDRTLDLPPGVVSVAPPLLVNAGIDRFAVSSHPLPQGKRGPEVALVRVFNATQHTHALIDVAGVRQPVALPPAGQTADFFVDVSAAGDTRVARLLSPDGSAWQDDVPGDDTAFLARDTPPGRPEPRTAVSTTLARFSAVYARRRPAGPESRPVLIVRGDPPADSLAVVLPTAMATTPAAVTLDASHPVSRSLRPDRLAGRPSPLRPVGDGWRTLASDNDAVLLAVRDAPARQVWVGFDAETLANDPAYVIFWTDVFDWLAGGTPTWHAGPVGRAGRAIEVADQELEQSPGSYADATGRPFATAMPAVRPGIGAENAAVSAEGVSRFSRREAPLGAYFLVAAIVLGAVGLRLARLDRV